MAVMTGAEWTATKQGKNVQIRHGDLSSTLDFTEANEFALDILRATGYKGTLGSVSNASKTATAKGGKTAKPKKGMKGGKGC